MEITGFPQTKGSRPVVGSKEDFVSRGAAGLLLPKADKADPHKVRAGRRGHRAAMRLRCSQRARGRGGGRRAPRTRRQLADARAAAASHPFPSLVRQFARGLREELQAVDPTLGWVWLHSFLIVVVLLMLNMLLAIIFETYSEVWAGIGCKRA